MGNQLTSTEKHIAIWLARGKSLPVICSQLAITAGTLRVHLCHIRAKTGIATLDPSKLTTWLERSDQPPKAAIKLTLTQTQKEVLQLVAQGKSAQMIAVTLCVALQTVHNHTGEGCRRLGISAQGKARLGALRAHFADWRNDPMF